MLNRRGTRLLDRDDRRAGSLPRTEAGIFPASDGEGRRNVEHLGFHYLTCTTITDCATFRSATTCFEFYKQTIQNASL